MRAESATAAKKPSIIPRASIGAQYLNACMTAQVEVKLKGVGDVGIHCCSCWDVPTLSNLQGTERDLYTEEFGYFQLPRALSLAQLPCLRTMVEGSHLCLRCRDCLPHSGGTEAAHPTLFPAQIGLLAFFAGIDTRRDMETQPTVREREQQGPILLQK